MMPFASHDQHVLDSVVAIGAAYVLALPLAWERRAKGRTHIGLRTLPLVSVGTCAYLLVSRYLYERGIFDADGLARTLRAMMIGVGFIGGGAILKGATRVEGIGGVTTAASVWTAGVIGASIAHGYYTLAVVVTLASLFVIEVSGRLVRVGRPGS